MNKFLFLDIDGVLNSYEYDKRRPPKEANHESRPSFEQEARLIDPDTVQRLNEILLRTNAYVIISSSWRGPEADSYRRIAQTLELRGLLSGLVHRFVGQTPDLSTQQTPTSVIRGTSRWDEIRAWLLEYEVGSDQGLPDYVDLDEIGSYLILDDDYLGQVPIAHYIQVDRRSGLSAENVQQAIEMLDRTAWPTVVNAYDLYLSRRQNQEMVEKINYLTAAIRLAHEQPNQANANRFLDAGLSSDGQGFWHETIAIRNRQKQANESGGISRNGKQFPRYLAHRGDTWLGYEDRDAAVSYLNHSDRGELFSVELGDYGEGEEYFEVSRIVDPMNSSQEVPFTPSTTDEQASVVERVLDFLFLRATRFQSPEGEILYLASPVRCLLCHAKVYDKGAPCSRCGAINNESVSA